MASTITSSASVAIAGSTPSDSSTTRISSHAHIKRTGASHSLGRWLAAPPRLGSRTEPRCMATVALSAATTDTESATFTSLKDLQQLPYVNKEGRILPPTEDGTAVSVFAVIDNNNRVQYIGFSKDIRNSLRTLIGRRPELCHFYKVLHLPVLDQKQMLAVRQQWVNEIGSIPRGNGEINQRNLWENPVDAGSISDRGKAAAAADRAKTLKQILMDKGVTETMEYNPELLAQGKCDILPSKEMTAEELAEAVKARGEDASKRFECKITSPEGKVIEFEIYYEMKFQTNAGWMYDILVTHDNKETRHRVICGSIYPDAANMEEDRLLETVMAFLLDKKIPRHTEGIRSTLTFPINYFAVGQVEQRWGEEFQAWFSRPLPTDHWNFRRLYSYGPRIDTELILGPKEEAEDSSSTESSVST